MKLCSNFFNKLTKTILVVGLFGCAFHSHALQVLTHGDSITQGEQRTALGVVYGVISHQNGSANVGGYQSRLNTKLDANLEPSTLYNWGHGGDNSALGLSRINTVLNSRSADYILIMFGANDLYQGISSSGTKANLRTMIDRSRAKGVDPIISEITPNTWISSFNPAIRLDYNPKIHALANEEDVPIALNYLAVDGPNWYAVPYHSGDQLHLSNAGYDRMADSWFNILRSPPKPDFTAIIQLLLLSE